MVNVQMYRIYFGGEGIYKAAVMAAQICEYAKTH